MSSDVCMMNEDKGDGLGEDITCEAISKVPDKSTHGCKYHQFIHKLPWSVILLALTRLVLQVVCFCFIQRKPSVVIKADGTTALNNIVRINKFLKYPYVPNKVPVLSIVLTPFTVDSAFSMLSTLSIIITAFLPCLQGNLHERRSKFFTASVSLCLLNTAVGLTHSLAASITYHHLLLANVGPMEAFMFLLISLIINAVQWGMWYCSLQYQKRLLTI